MLRGGGRAAPQVPLAPLPPGEGLPHLGRPPPAAPKEPKRTTSPAPPQLPFGGLPAALPLPPFLSAGSKKSPRRSPRRPRQVHRRPAGAGNAPLGGHGEPQRGGSAAPRPLLQPRRGHPAGSTRRTPQALPKPGLGQQLGRAPALKGSRPSNCQALTANKRPANCRKGLRVTNSAGGVAIPTRAAFSPFSWGYAHRCLLLSLAERHGASPSGLAQPRRPALTTMGLHLCSLSASLPRAQRHGSW